MRSVKSTVLCASGLAVALLGNTASLAGTLGNSASFDAVYAGDILSNQRGGIDSGSAYLDNLDLMLDVDVSEAVGGRVFAYVLYNNGEPFSASHVGDAQVVTNIETVRAWRLYELWYEHPFNAGSTSLRAGLYDLNAEFYATDSSALFLHAAHGIGTDFSQSGEMGPSIFSITGLALRLQHDFVSTLSVRAAVIDGVPGNPKYPDRMAATLRGDDGLLAVGEIDFHPGTYRAGIGAWRYSRRQPTQDAAGEAISWGSYGFVEWPLSGATLDEANARFFLRGGIAEDSVNRFSDFVGAGVVFNGNNWGRASDSAGFAIAHARNGGAYRDLVDPADKSETAFELTYRIAFNDRFALQPDLQYVINPDTNPTLDDALVIGVRAELTLY